jgi:MFS family permease
LVLGLPLLCLADLLLGSQTVLRFLPLPLGIGLAPEQPLQTFEHGPTIASGAVSRYRWTILALGTGAQAAYSGVFLGIPVLAPALRAEYALTLPEIGLVIAAVNVGSVVTLIPWGLLADRIGERFVLATGLMGASAALVMAAFASSFAVFVAAITVAGALGAGVNAASGRAVMGWFEERQRGFALGIRQTAVPLGGMTAALALPPIAAAWGVRGGLVALACGCFAWALAGLSGLREAPESEEELGALAHPLKDGRIWRLSIGSGLILGAQASILGFMVLFLHGERGLSTAAAGGVLALTQLVGAALRVLALALAASLVVTAALIRAPLAVLLPTLVAAGALSLSWNALSFTAAAELAGRARSGAALGFQQTALSVASTTAPPLFAATVAASSWGVGFGLAALFPLAGLAVLRRLAI